MPKFQSDADGPVSVAVFGTASSIHFVPGDVRTVETDDPAEVAALRANPDVSEVKESRSSSSSSSRSERSNR